MYVCFSSEAILFIKFPQYLGIIQEFRCPILFHIRMLQLWNHSTLILFYQISTILRYYSRIFMELLDCTYNFTYLSSTVEASTDSSYYNRKQVFSCERVL